MAHTRANWAFAAAFASDLEAEVLEATAEEEARCAEARAVAAHWSSPSFIRKSSVLTLVQPVVRVREF